MKTVLLSIVLAMGLALLGAQPRAAVDQLMAAGRIAGDQVYNAFRD